METIIVQKKAEDAEKMKIEIIDARIINQQKARIQTIRKIVPKEKRRERIITRRRLTSEAQTEIFTKKRALFEMKLVESDAFLKEKEFVYCATLQIRNETYFIIPKGERINPMSTFKRNGFHWFEWPPRETGLKIIDRKNINGRTSGDVIRIVFVEISKETDLNC